MDYFTPELKDGLKWKVLFTSNGNIFFWPGGGYDVSPPEAI